MAMARQHLIIFPVFRHISFVNHHETSWKSPDCANLSANYSPLYAITFRNLRFASHCCLLFPTEIHHEFAANTMMRTYPKNDIPTNEFPIICCNFQDKKSHVGTKHKLLRYGAFQSHGGYPNSWMVYFMDNPVKIRMITRGTPYVRKPTYTYPRTPRSPQLFPHVHDLWGTACTKAQGRAWEGCSWPAFMGVHTIDVPNSHWLVDEKRGLCLNPLVTTGKWWCRW